MNESELIQTQMSVVSACINFFSLLCTFATLVVAILAYKSIVRDKLQQEQLKAILDLIEILRTKNFNIQFINNQGMQLNFSSEFNLFTLANFGQRASTVKYVSYSNFEDMWISISDLEFFQRIANCECNPLLPKAIAEHLTAFWIHLPDIQVVGITLKTITPNSCVIIAEQQTQPSQIYNVSNFLNHQIQYKNPSAFKSWKIFILSYQNLIQEIKTWMRSHGIVDINL
ncbi:hypothetical protein STA3757_08120 [Stanieria sp. NIES-3757]|nr:hypothetical protein STA3757_08120 [Stanieria sp. NIES-3757]